MREDALKLGYDIYIDSGYRDSAYQQNILNYYLKTMGEDAYQKVAKPGESEHILGTAIDLGTLIDGKYCDEINDSMDVTKWIFENAHKYGFILRYPKGKEDITGFNYEPWHLRFVGPKLATYLTKNNLTLEEYYDLKRSGDLMNFPHLNYQDVNQVLDNLVKEDTKVKVTKEEPLGYTDFNLPINHYTMGHGKKHIIVTGSYHAAEIITTIFIVKLMENLAHNVSFNEDDYTIHFIPIMNPEGYLITTSMQDEYLKQGKTPEEKVLLAKKYYQVYRRDAINTNKAKKENDVATLRSKKGYQALFDNVNINSYLKDYPELKASVMDILKKNNYPLGVCAAWTANGHGIDLSQNAPFNAKIEQYQKEDVYASNAYSNIKSSAPGPINCPTRDLNHFTFEKENLHLLNFLMNLSQKGEIVLFLNYHSVMAKIYQRPVKNSILDIYPKDLTKQIIEEYLGARHLKEENAYDIIEDADPYNYINEYFRLRFGLNLQPELSRMGSNPIGPLGDPDTFNNVTINPNIEAFKNLVNNLDFIKNFTNFINYLVNYFNDLRKEEHKEELDPIEIYRLIDNILLQNPTLYAKLRAEFSNHNNYNSHVITHFITLLKQNIINNKHDSSLNYQQNYLHLIDDLVLRINNTRKTQNKEPLTKEEINTLLENLIKDYPEIYAKLNFYLQQDDYSKELVDNLEEHLNQLIVNQLKMGNLIR